MPECFHSCSSIASPHGQRLQDSAYRRGCNVRRLATCAPLLLSVLFCCGLLCCPALGQETDSWRTRPFGKFVERLSLKVGENVGGVLPDALIDGMQLRSYSPKFAPIVALRYGVSFYEQWGLEIGLRFEMKGMTTRVWVHDYYTMVDRRQQGTDTRVKGHFTGEVFTEVSSSYFTLPLRFSYRIAPRMCVKLGGYWSYALTPSFAGAVEKGYFWTMTEGGQGQSDKIDIERETYDFSPYRRHSELGLEALFAYRWAKNFFCEGGISYGLTSIFQDSFRGLASPMRNLYLSLGVGYHFAGL